VGDVLNLRGRSALVTGGGRRLGKAFAEGLVRAGANVVVHYHRSEGGAREVVEQAQRTGARAVLLRGDLSDAAGPARLLEQAVEALGSIDYLVNSAAAFEAGDPLQTTPRMWSQHLDLNLRAPFLLSQSFARASAGREGSIVNILDWRGTRPEAAHFAYSLSKSALASMTRSLALALAPSIRVNGLALGAILPPANGPAEEDLVERVPLRRWGSVDEAVRALLFLLAGPQFMTGQILHVDGGRHIG
jgi:NAD(P)-dependent dehydrogenase (short-subunit alcohol dehydrogenase family)